jgi:hypothetical protein
MTLGTLTQVLGSHVNVQLMPTAWEAPEVLAL